MFNFKEMINRVAHGQSPNSPARNNEPDTAEGFLCPLCMNAFGTQDELQNHYSTSHKDFEPPSGGTTNAENSNVFHAFHHGVRDKYMHTHQAATVAEEAKESIPDVNSLDLPLDISKMSPEIAVKELVKRLTSLIKQKDLLGEEKVLAEQRATALTEKVGILMATVEKAEMEKDALSKRLAVVESQLAHRENIDDAAVLRQELIQVQRVMDEMTREREKESDQLKRDLENLQQKYNKLESESKNFEIIEKDAKRMQMLEESIQLKDKVIADTNDKLIMLKETVTSLENESFQKSSKLKETELELEKVKSSLTELESEKKSSQKRIAELEERLMEASLAQEKTDREFRKLEEALSCQEENAKKSSQIISDLKAEIFENSNSVSNKNKELMALNEKVEILTSQLKESTIMNEDLRCRNAEQARYLEDKMKLVLSMEDKEKEFQLALEKNVAQMDSLNKNYLELMGFIQAQMKDNNKVDSDSEKKILGQIESAVNLLSKKTSEFDNLAANDKQLQESLQKEGRSSLEEFIKMLQTECKDQAEQLKEADRKISSLSNSIQSEVNKGKAKTEEFEAIINSLKLNLEQCKGDLTRSNRMCQELEEKISDQRILMAKKEEEICQLNAKHTRKTDELKKVTSVCSFLGKEFLSCKEALSSFSVELTQYNKLCLDKIRAISVIHAQVEKEAKEVPLLQEKLSVVQKLVSDKDNEIEELMKNLLAEKKRSSELEDSNSIKLMEIEELKKDIGLEKEKVYKITSEMENLSLTQRKMQERIDECENKVKSLTGDLLGSEKMVADLQVEKEQLEAKIVTDLHEKELEIKEILEQSEERFLKQTQLADKEIGELKEKYQQEINKLESEIENLSAVIAKEEQQKEEVKKNLEEELLANSTLQQEFTIFRNKHESSIAMLTENVNSLKLDLSLREEAEKGKESMIEKLQEQNSSLKAEFETERQALLERYIESTKENDRLKGITNEFRRQLDNCQAALHEIGRENQTYQMEISKLLGRKWTDDSDVTNCLKCNKEFSIRVRKHHCRHCGQIFCNDCSSKLAAVASSKKPVRVCEACYVELVEN